MGHNGVLKNYFSTKISTLLTSMHDAQVAN